MKQFLIITIAAYALLSCGAAEESDFDNTAAMAEAKEEYAPSPANNAISTTAVPINRKIIWTGDLELQVEDVNKATSHINKICSKYGAFVSNMNMNSDSYEISNRITVRIENKNFTPFINDVKGKADYIRKLEISSNDVTEEFIDIESRLKTKKEVRDRYIEILKTKTGKVSDIIKAEEAIRVITEEIEAKEGRLRYLKDKVKFSTIHILIFQKVEYRPIPEVYEKTYLDKSLQALKNGWNIVTVLVLGLMNIWPLLLIFMLIYWKRKWIKSKFKKSNKTKEKQL